MIRFFLRGTAQVLSYPELGGCELPYLPNDFFGDAGGVVAELDRNQEFVVAEERFGAGKFQDDFVVEEEGVAL